MKTFEKIYIGKGKQIKDLRIVRISLRVEDILEHAHEFNGEQFITFEVASLQNPDKFGNGYTVYVSKKVETAEKATGNATKTAAPEPKKSKKAPKKSDDKYDGNIPF